MVKPTQAWPELHSAYRPSGLSLHHHRIRTYTTHAHNHIQARPRKQQPFPTFVSSSLVQERHQGSPAFPWAEEYTHPLSSYHDQHMQTTVKWLWHTAESECSMPTCQHLRGPGRYFVVGSLAPQPSHQEAGSGDECKGRGHHLSYTFERRGW